MIHFGRLQVYAGRGADASHFRREGLMLLGKLRSEGVKSLDANIGRKVSVNSRD